MILWILAWERAGKEVNQFKEHFPIIHYRKYSYFAFKVFSLHATATHGPWTYTCKILLTFTYKERSVIFVDTGPRFGMVSSSLLFSFLKNAQKEEWEGRLDNLLFIEVTIL